MIDRERRFFFVFFFFFVFCFFWFFFFFGFFFFRFFFSFSYATAQNMQTFKQSCYIVILQAPYLCITYYKTVIDQREFIHFQRRVGEALSPTKLICLSSEKGFTLKVMILLPAGSNFLPFKLNPFFL